MAEADTASQWAASSHAAGARRSRRRVPEPEASRAGARWSEGPWRGGAAAESAARRPLSERPRPAAPEGGLAPAGLPASRALGAAATAFPLGPRPGDGPGLHGLARAPPLSPRSRAVGAGESRRAGRESGGAGEWGRPRGLQASRRAEQCDGLRWPGLSGGADGGPGARGSSGEPGS